jgi:hypothetical protein
MPMLANPEVTGSSSARVVFPYTRHGCLSFKKQVNCKNGLEILNLLDEIKMHYYYYFIRGCLYTFHISSSDKFSPPTTSFNSHSLNFSPMVSSNSHLRVILTSTSPFSKNEFCLSVVWLSHSIIQKFIPGGRWQLLYIACNQTGEGLMARLECLLTVMGLRPVCLVSVSPLRSVTLIWGYLNARGSTHSKIGK